jgi:acyl-coenzyme A thioesterase PaaI-like protein
MIMDRRRGTLSPPFDGRTLLSRTPTIHSKACSRVELVHLMRRQHANFAGNVHGGVILGLMDEVVHACSDSECHSSWRRWAQGISHSS